MSKDNPVDSSKDKIESTERNEKENIENPVTAEETSEETTAAEDLGFFVPADAVESKPTEVSPSEEKIQSDSPETSEAEGTDSQIVTMADGFYNTAVSNQGAGAETYSPVVPPVEGVSYVDSVEVERIRFFSHYRKMKIINYCIVGVVMALIVAVIVLVLVSNTTGNGSTWGPYAIWPLFGLAIATFIVASVFSHFVKKGNNVLLNAYLDRWCDLMASWGYQGEEGVTDLEYCPDAKVQDADIINTHYWTVINAIDSRNRIVGRLDGVLFSDTEVIVECPPYSTFAVEIESAKYKDVSSPAAEEVADSSEQDPSFWYSRAYDGEGQTAPDTTEDRRDPHARAANIGGFGKFLSFDIRAQRGEGLIVTRTVSDSYPPTDIRGLSFNQDAASLLGEDFTVWSSSEEFARKVLTSEVVEILQGLENDGILMDWFMSFNSNELSFLLNFADEVMELPFRTMPSEQTLLRYPLAVKRCLKVARLLSDKRKA